MEYPEAPSLALRARALIRDVRDLFCDHLELAALEARRAGAGFAKMVCAAVVISILFVSAWLALVAGAIVWATSAGVPWPGALAIAAIVNVVAGVVACAVDAPAGTRAAVCGNAAATSSRRQCAGRRSSPVTTHRSPADDVGLVELRIERRREQLLRDWEDARTYVAQKNRWTPLAAVFGMAALGFGLSANRRGPVDAAQSAHRSKTARILGIRRDARQRSTLPAVADRPRAVGIGAPRVAPATARPAALLADRLPPGSNRSFLRCGHRHQPSRLRIFAVMTWCVLRKSAHGSVRRSRRWVTLPMLK